MFRRDVQFLEDSFGPDPLGEHFDTNIDPLGDPFDTQSSDPLGEQFSITSPSDQIDVVHPTAVVDRHVRFNVGEEEVVEVEEEEPAVVRPRIRRGPDRLGEWATIATASTDPKTFKQAMNEHSTEMST